jgi:hypothetical protein
LFKIYTNLLIVLFVVCNIGGIQNSFGQKLQNKNKPITVEKKESTGNDDRIIFLMLKMAKDSITGNDTLILMDKIEKKGKIKSRPYIPGLSRFPYLSAIFYKNNVPIDSMRLSYPLRERIQNTKTNIQGYEEVEKGSMEFFMRLRQNEADKVSFFKITYSENKKLLTADL